MAHLDSGNGISFLLFFLIATVQHVAGGPFTDWENTYDFYSQSSEQEPPQYKAATETQVQWFDHMVEPWNKTELMERLKEYTEDYYHLEYAMELLDRADFTLDTPYHMKAVPIGFNSHLDAPQTIAKVGSLCMDHLQWPNRSKTEYPMSYFNKKVLDIGCGVGYLSAVFGHLVGHTGQVIAIEHVPEVVKLAKMAYSYDHWHFLQSEKVKFIVKDGRKGHAEEGPYDIIHVGAAIVECPKEIVEQLKPGGRLIYRKGEHYGNYQILTVIDRAPNGTILPEEEVWEMDETLEGLRSLKEQMDEYKLMLAGKYKKIWRIDMPPNPPPEFSEGAHSHDRLYKKPRNYTGYTHAFFESWEEGHCGTHARSDFLR